MFALLETMGNPHHRYPVVHIAGTKGKGSVAAMCAGALQAGGYRTGLYTSPHLLDFRERVQVNGQYVAPDQVAALVTDLQPLEAAQPGLTTFELTTALAFEHFARQRVDAAVIEVGLGGRLDATNVLRPRACVITALSLDHTALLGDTVAQIAAEKGGIIKAGVPVVCAPQPPEALVVLERMAGDRGAPLIQVGRDWLYRPIAHNLERQSLAVWSAEEQRQLDTLRAAGHIVDWRPEVLELQLLGEHQVENAAVAYAALQVLREQGLPLAAGPLRAGLAATRWPGRFEIAASQPAVVLDGAHNADSARRLAAALHGYFPGRRCVLVLGVSADKDLPGILRALLTAPAGEIGHVIATQAQHPRAQDPAEVAALVRQYNIGAEVIAPVDQAVNRAVGLAGPDGVVLVTGSLFVVAEARAVLPGQGAAA
jgi:dihydrofolate synthase/folylpolyglutamate synthase